MKKYIKKILIFIILVIISLTAIFYVKADSGWDSDYGSSDWGGSSWDSDYSSSYDYDYGSGYSRHDSGFDYSGSVNTSGKTDKVKAFIIFLLTIGSWILIPTSSILLSSLFSKNKNNNYKRINNYYDVSDDIFKTYFNSDIEIIKKQLYDKFIDVQKSWMNFDYDNLRKLCTDELYNQYKTQLETLKLTNGQNIMSDFTLNDIKIYNIIKSNDVVRVNVFLDVQFKDYVINTKNNKVVRGSKNIYFDNGYELAFVMSNNNKTTICPSCGAQLEVISSNVCPHCKNTIVQVSDELVLSKKKIVLSFKR